jgi:prepilin-type N-terminal cleavage/methylation domain-containing protein
MILHTDISTRSRRGFTLTEILLAMLVFAIAISTILALLARSVETAQEILTKDEALGLSTAVEDYMTAIPFATAYEVVRDPDRRLLFAYQYRADSDSDPVADPDSPYEVIATAREPADIPDIPTLTPALESRFFRVVLSVSPTNPATQPGAPADPPLPLPANPDTGYPPNYNSAVLVVFAEFYPVPTVAFIPEDTVPPVFSYNFAVRR